MKKCILGIGISEAAITGFTLAEVLVTLTIIGVIAALTIPSLITNIQDAQFKTAYKKAFAIASQVTLTATQNQLFMARTTQFETAPSLYNFNVFMNQFSVAKLCYSNNDSECWDLSGELACDGTCGSGSPHNSNLGFIDTSGMAWNMYSTQEGLILVDTNGLKGPNHYGKDRWILKFTDQYNNQITAGLPAKIMPLYTGDEPNFENMTCHYPPCNYASWLKQ